MDSSPPVVAVVVAAGSGTRLGDGPPKALRDVGGRSLVRHSLDALANGGVDAAIVVIAPGEQAAFETALADAPIPAGYVYGGARRQDSVRAGLAAIAGDPKLAECTTVLVHDAARALVPADVVTRVIEAVGDGASGCVPVIPVVDSIRRQNPDGTSQVVDRTPLRAVQTPQGFRREVLEKALAHAEEAGLEVSDDATAIEAIGEAVVLVDGSREALKVTVPADLVLAEAIARSRG
ncbi:MAG: 2-C-methyl-D-erythritol 4-phosphate cytidylyltransferase [Propionibacteriales bacterium]|nr:2-C-methyl-D-erythritol 4-phosphate cytidylyltransferase [Propionibacteriales bacterium]